MKYRYFHKHIQSAPKFGKTLHFKISQFSAHKTKDISGLYRIYVENLDGSMQFTVRILRRY